MNTLLRNKINHFANIFSKTKIAAIPGCEKVQKYSAFRHQEEQTKTTNLTLFYMRRDDLSVNIRSVRIL